MIQLIFDVVMLGLVGYLGRLLHHSSKQINELQAGIHLPTNQELEHVRRLEIAAGIREPDPPKEPMSYKCLCKHGVQNHRPGRQQGCTVAVNNRLVCACEWGQTEVIRFLKKEGEWA